MNSSPPISRWRERTLQRPQDRQLAVGELLDEHLLARDGRPAPPAGPTRASATRSASSAAGRTGPSAATSCASLSRARASALRPAASSAWAPRGERGDEVGGVAPRAGQLDRAGEHGAGRRQVALGVRELSFGRAQQRQRRRGGVAPGRVPARRPRAPAPGTAAGPARARRSAPRHRRARRPACIRFTGEVDAVSGQLPRLGQHRRRLRRASRAEQYPPERDPGHGVPPLGRVDLQLDRPPGVGERALDPAAPRLDRRGADVRGGGPGVVPALERGHVRGELRLRRRPATPRPGRADRHPRSPPRPGRRRASDRRAPPPGSIQQPSRKTSPLAPAVDEPARCSHEQLRARRRGRRPRSGAGSPRRPGRARGTTPRPWSAAPGAPPGPWRRAGARGRRGTAGGSGTTRTAGRGPRRRRRRPPARRARRADPARPSIASHSGPDIRSSTEQRTSRSCCSGVSRARTSSMK